MGFVKSIDIADIRPSENLVGQELCSIIRVLSFYFENTSEQKLPPVVRPFYGEYLSVDGRNRLLFSDLFNEKKSDVYVAEHARDYILPEQFPEISEAAIEDSNRCIRNRWTYVPEFVEQLKKQGVRTYSDLRKDRPYLESIAKAKALYLDEANSEQVRVYWRYDIDLLPKITT